MTRLRLLGLVLTHWTEHGWQLLLLGRSMGADKAKNIALGFQIVHNLSWPHSRWLLPRTMRRVVTLFEESSSGFLVAVHCLTLLVGLQQLVLGFTGVVLELRELLIEECFHFLLIFSCDLNHFVGLDVWLSEEHFAVDVYRLWRHLLVIWGLDVWDGCYSTFWTFSSCVNG